MEDHLQRAQSHCLLSILDVEYHGFSHTSCLGQLCLGQAAFFSVKANDQAYLLFQNHFYRPSSNIVVLCRLMFEIIYLHTTMYCFSGIMSSILATRQVLGTEFWKYYRYSGMSTPGSRIGGCEYPPNSASCSPITSPFATSVLTVFL